MKVLALTQRSVTLELDNPNAYFSNEEFTVLLNGVPQFKENRNVFSLFSLEPETTYVVSAGEEQLSFTTASESCFMNVKAFHAAGDGICDDTPAFRAAIACLPPNGTLYVPEGTYRICPLFLKSDMLLYLERGAVLIGDTNRENYPVLPGLADDGHGGQQNFGTWQGEEVPCYASLLTGIHCKNLAIVGQGSVNCSGSEGDWYQNYRVMRRAWRPRGMFFNRCQNVLLQGIHVYNTPSWNIHPYFCDRIRLLDLRLENDPQMPTTDGIDPDTCTDVQIIGVYISVGDDCIAIKSGTIEQAKKYRKSCKGIVIRNCLMCQGHGGVVLGSELSGGIEDIHVSRCIFRGTDRGLRIKTRRGRGHYGITGGITFSQIRMEDVKVPFVVNMYYNMGDNTGHTEYVWTTEKLPVDELTPFIGSFLFEDMVCTGVGYAAGVFYGLPEAPIERVALKNVSFSYDPDCLPGYPAMKEKNEKLKNSGLIFQFAKEVLLENVTFSGCATENVSLEGVDLYRD